MVLLSLWSAALLNTSVFATEGKSSTLYYMGEDEQVKTDNNYDNGKKITSGDPHYGWNLGKFCISGYSGNPQTVDGKLVFLKNVGDEISLSFLLEQNIDKLNGKEYLSISDDTKAYDEYFHIFKDKATRFGKGMLFIKKTDYQNTLSYKWYRNYLNGVSKGANTAVTLFEEGDYEIALDYELEEKHFGFVPTKTNYQIRIAFSVRNSNCMVYPFDVATGSELINTAFTENGFYLDLARSRYLDINIVKQLFVDSDNSLKTDTRFNKTATDGEKFTDEGIYIITVHNKYTSAADTVKTIYVGDNPILKAYVTTGEDIAHIKELVANGAIIEEDGSITIPEKPESQESETVHTETSETAVAETSETTAEGDSISQKKMSAPIVIIVFILCAAVLFAVGLIVRKTHNKAKKNEHPDLIVPDPEETSK